MEILSAKDLCKSYGSPDSNSFGQFVRLQHRKPKGNAE